MLYRFDQTSFDTRANLNVVWERAAYDDIDDTGMMMVMRPVGRQLLVFEGKDEIIAQIDEAVRPVYERLQKELEGGDMDYHNYSTT